MVFVFAEQFMQELKRVSPGQLKELTIAAQSMANSNAPGGVAPDTVPGQPPQPMSPGAEAQQHMSDRAISRLPDDKWVVVCRLHPMAVAVTTTSHTGQVPRLCAGAGGVAAFDLVRCVWPHVGTQDVVACLKVVGGVTVCYSTGAVASDEPDEPAGPSSRSGGGGSAGGGDDGSDNGDRRSQSGAQHDEQRRNDRFSLTSCTALVPSLQFSLRRASRPPCGVAREPPPSRASALTRACLLAVGAANHRRPASASASEARPRSVATSAAATSTGCRAAPAAIPPAVAAQGRALGPAREPVPRLAPQMVARSRRSW